MPKFCPNCGAQVADNAKFCLTCGKPLAAQQPVQPQQPQYQQQYQQAPQYQPQYQQPQYQQVPQYQQQYQQPVYAQPPKKKGKGGIVFLVILLLAAIGVVCYFGFRDGGWFRSKPSIVDAENVGSLYDYAKRLEDAGNYAAAQAVYDLIAKGASGELINKAHEDIPALRSADDLNQFSEITKGFRKGE